MSANREVNHSACTDPGRSPGCTHTHTRRARLPETVARAAVVAPPGDLHPPARGSMEREHRQRIFRRNAVPSVDVPQRWWSARRPRRLGFAEGAALSGLASLASIWAVLVAMGDRFCLRPEVNV